MSKPWGRVGAWAADVEAEEQEAAAASAAAASAPAEPESFPSLKEAAATKPKKKKMALSEFVSGTYVGPGAGRRNLSGPEFSKGLTPNELLHLPTGPRDRTDEEIQYGRLGGGFRSYGPTGPPARFRGDEGGSGRRSYGGFDDDRRGPSPRASEFDQPSRADEVDNWAAAKKPIAFTAADSGRRDRYTSLGSGSGSGFRADEVDNWAAVKKALPAKSSGFGSGFRDTGLDSDRWTRSGPHEGDRDRDRDRPRLLLDPPSGGVSTTEPARPRPSPFGAARPREEVLTGKGLDWRKLDSAIEIRKLSRPISSHSSRPSSAHSVSSHPESPAGQTEEGAPKPRQRVNPFGDAKPREVLLEERGKDWRKIDLLLEHRSVDRPETEEEKMLKEEINELKKEMAEEAEMKSNGQSVPESAEDHVGLQELIQRKERDLELLILKLDDKVRFGQRAIDRPTSGAGRVAAFTERPPSQSGRSESSRSVEFIERPRSRESDVWTKPGDDKRAYQGIREGGILGNRDIDRSRSRERW